MMRWIKKAAVSLLIKDDTAYPRTQVSYNGVTTSAYRFAPYGLASHPPLGSLSVLLSPDGRRDDPVALIADPLNRAKDLAEGEVQLENHLTKSFLKFRADKGVELSVAQDGDLVVTLVGGNASIDVTGDIDVTASGNVAVTAGGTVDVDATGNVNVTAPTVAIDGNLTVTGTIVATGEVTGATKALSTHTHNETGTGGGVTGPPN